MSKVIQRPTPPPLAPGLKVRSNNLAVVLVAVGWFIMLNAAPAQTHKLRVHDPAAARALVSQGGKVLADYESFQVIESSQTLPADANSDALQVVDHFDLIQLNGRQLNTRAPELQSLRTSVAAPSGKGLRLVHFAGPVKPEWLQSLEKNGTRVISYIPHNAYLVYGDAPALASLQSWAGSEASVQWEGRYLAEYKIHPRARATDAKGNPRTIGTATFAVQLVADTAANAETLRLIDQLKLGAVRSEYTVLQYRNVIVDLPADRLDELAAMPDVISIQPYFKRMKRDERQDQIMAGNLTGGVPNGPGYLAWLASKGFTQEQFDASGFAVDVTDSGIDNGTRTPGHFGLYPTGDVSRVSRVVYNRLEGTPNPGSTLRGCDGHGTLDAHIVAGYSAFSSGFPHADAGGYSYGLGVCPFVKVGSSVVFDSDEWTSPNYTLLQTRAWNSGARISNNSWGSSAAGLYDVEAQTFDALVRDVGASSSNRQMVIVFAAGNSGPTSGAFSLGINPPATAKNVISVGSSHNVRSLSTANGGTDAAGTDGCDVSDAEASYAENVTGHSSQGPCEDGRMKPDLVAPGTHITSGVAQNGPATTGGTGNAISCFEGTGVCGLVGLGMNFFPLGQEFYTVSTGTSHAAPAVAGSCALVRQYFINQSNAPPSPAMTKAYLMNAARYLTGSYANDTLWSPAQGMGAVNLGTAFDGVPRVLHDQVPLERFTTSGQARTFSGTIVNPSKPFRVTLAWTDAPGSTAAASALVNDLDLTVTAGGQTYKGNVFSGAHSTTAGSADALNNVESVFLPAGVTGPFSVSVSAANIAADALNSAAPVPQQDFALVIYNADEIPAPVIALTGYAITGESCAAGNGVADPGETLTLEISLRNVGQVDTTNLTVTLLEANGAVSPSGAQVYGALAAGGGTVTRTFTFTAAGACGQVIRPTFNLADNSTELGAVATKLPLGTPVPVFLQNFDAVTAPALPIGWTSSTSLLKSPWATIKKSVDSAPNAIFAMDPELPSLNVLTSPAFPLPYGAAQLMFRNLYNLEITEGGTAFDGGVLEIKIGTGPFTDILAAGGSFVAGGYNVVLYAGTVLVPSKNALGGRPAWGGNSGGYITTIANLPAAAEGKTIQLRWRCGTDLGNLASFPGWYIDSVAVKSSWCCPDPRPTAPFVPEAGSYSGLFFESAGVRYLSSGAVTATTTSQGKYSGTLKLGPTSFKFTGQFGPFGVATNVILRPGTNALTLVLRMETLDNNRITGTVSGGSWLADLDAERARFNAKTNPAPFAGSYTLSFPGSGNPADATRPLGDGYGTVTVSTAGQVKLSGALADGTTLSGTTTISKFGQWPLYTAFTGGQMLGWLTISNTAQGDLGGLFNWIKLPNVNAKNYKAGFSWGTDVTGSALQPAAIPPLAFTNGTVALTGGNLAASITNLVMFNLGKVVNLSSNVLKLTVSKGIFKGTVVNPATSKSVSFQGAILQKQNYGSGYFLGTNQSGRVTFGP